MKQREDFIVVIFGKNKRGELKQPVVGSCGLGATWFLADRGRSWPEWQWEGPLS